MSHSPLPWKYIDNHRIEDKNGFIITYCPGGNELFVKNVEFIINCVNNYEKLVHALHALDVHTEPHDINCRGCIAEQALAEAGEL